MWADTFAPREVFLAKTALSGIPEVLRSHMWTSFQRKVVQEGPAAAFATSVSLPPTIDEWMSRVRSLPKKSAGGPSGLTYDMVQCWPLEIHVAVLAAHNALWAAGRIPSNWSQKWLVLIPKGAGGSLDDFRPLMLIEALRKIWSGIFLRRIRNFLEENKLLHPSQHGMCRGAGTDTAHASTHLSPLASGVRPYTSLHGMSKGRLTPFQGNTKSPASSGLGSRSLWQNTLLIWMSTAKSLSAHL